MSRCSLIGSEKATLIWQAILSNSRLKRTSTITTTTTGAAATGSRWSCQVHGINEPISNLMTFSMQFNQHSQVSCLCVQPICGSLSRAFRVTTCSFPVLHLSISPFIWKTNTLTYLLTSSRFRPISETPRLPYPS